MKQLSSSGASEPEVPERWGFLRDVLVFQMKLFVDAIRDLMLSPVSIIAGVIDLISGYGAPVYTSLASRNRGVVMWSEHHRLFSLALRACFR